MPGKRKISDDKSHDISVMFKRRTTQLAQGNCACFIARHCESRSSNLDIY